MFKIICVTNRKLCSDFSERIKKISEQNVPIILREKDLSEAKYKEIAHSAVQECADMILHTYIGAAKELGVKKIHLPIKTLCENPSVRRDFDTVGASVHSTNEAREAQRMGADYVVAGHIFATDCKKGLAPRGLDFLREVCESVTIPVYAIGGITPDNIASVRRAGASGACIMSAFMTCPLDEIEKLIRSFRRY